MESYLSLAQGTLLRLSLALFVLGLLRHVGLHVWFRVQHRLGLGAPEYQRRLLPPVVAPGLGPVGRVFQVALVAVILVTLVAITLFFHTHMAIFQNLFGFDWPVLPREITDVLGFAAIAAAAVLFIWKWTVPAYRQPVRLRYFFWTPLIIFSLVFGYLTGHPAHSPFGYDVTRLIHVLSAEALLALSPFAFVGSWADIPAAAPAPSTAAEPSVARIEGGVP